MSNTVRQPKQERAIEKKNRIIQAGYELFSEKGFFSCTTPEIAARAGVSTGIVYGYFRDKRDILLCVLEIYINRSFMPVMQIMREVTPPADVSEIVRRLMDKTIEIHRSNAALHETLHSLTASDKEVADKFLELENHITESVTAALPRLGVHTSHPAEKVHLAMNLMQSFSHEYVFDNHSYIDYTAMYEIVCDAVTKLFV